MATFAELLAKELTADLVWREEELAVMRKQLYLSEKGSIQEKVLLRANLTMTYAHYEGYCKFALDLYLDALSKLKLKRGELIWKLAVFSMGSFRSELTSSSNSADFFTLMLTKFNDVLDEQVNFGMPLKTSNLWPNLLISWLDQLDLQSGSVKNFETLLESLVRNRNEIAHGKKLIVSSRKDLDKYSNAALVAMHEVAVGVVVSLETKGYKRGTAGTTLLKQAI